jgi:hypothetical protein
MKRLVVFGFVLASFIAATPVHAQEGPAGAGRAEITIIPVGTLMFTENSDASAPGFGSYQLGGTFTYNLNRYVGVEGEVASSIGLSQNLGFGYPSTERTPDVLNYNGNVVVSVPNGSSVVPYVTGGVGGLSLFSREALASTRPRRSSPPTSAAASSGTRAGGGFVATIGSSPCRRKTRPRRSSVTTRAMGIVSTAP